MPKGRPLSAAHKAAISAGLKRYHATRRANSGGGGSKTTFNIDTGGQISREEAAIRMFGTAGARARLAGGKKRRR